MEDIKIRKKKKKDKKPLFILVGFLLFFGLFIYVITRPSSQSKALNELNISFSKKDVEVIWYKYKADLYQDEEFLFEIRKKLTSFKLSENELIECASWLPKPPTSLNLIIIPDLSRRINDTINNPDQIENDIFVLNIIWKSFIESSKLNQDTQDKLIVDVTDIDQAKGQFGKIANNLQFDLSSHKGKSNRLFFTDEKNQLFEQSVNMMYELAKGKPLGADYRFYIRRYLGSRIKKSTLFDDFVNKVVIITDGYLEAQNKPADTKIYGLEKQLHESVTNGNTLQVITNYKLNIPKIDIDLTNTEVLICEVNERKAGKGFDFEILQTYWEDWFKRMNVKRMNFIPREQSNELTAKKVRDFIIINK